MERLLAGRSLRLRGKAKERAVMGGLGPGGLMYHNFEECGIIHPFLNEEVYEKHKMAIKPLR